MRQGHAPEAITGLAYLVTPAHYRQAILWWFERKEKQVNGYLAQIAYTLKKVATYGVTLPPEDLAQIEAAYGRVAGRAEPGGAVSRERMKQFDSPQACRAFLAYPTRKIEAVRKSDRGSIAEALAVQWAAGLELWLFAPLRITNFVQLRLDEHLFWPNRDRPGPLLVSVSRRTVKNRENLDFEIPAEVAAHVKLYIERFRPRLVTGPNPWLFPGDNGGPKHVATWRHQIQRAVWTEAGLEIHPHLLRRIGPKLFLELHPEMKPIIQHLLGHRSIRSTAVYTGAERKAALRLYDATILELRRAALDGTA